MLYPTLLFVYYAYACGMRWSINGPKLHVKLTKNILLKILVLQKNLWLLCPCKAH